MGFKIKDEFRKNSLSLYPGGCTVIVEYHESAQPPLVREYDKIKYPGAYIAMTLKNPKVKDAYVK